MFIEGIDEFLDLLRSFQVINGDIVFWNFRNVCGADGQVGTLQRPLQNVIAIAGGGDEHYAIFFADFFGIGFKQGFQYRVFIAVADREEGFFMELPGNAAGC